MTDAVTREALKRWGFPEQGDPDFGERASAALLAIDKAHGVLYPQQHELLATLNFEDDPRRVGAFYFGLLMQAGDYVARDAASGGQA